MADNETVESPATPTDEPASEPAVEAVADAVPVESSHDPEGPTGEESSTENLFATLAEEVLSDEPAVAAKAEEPVKPAEPPADVEPVPPVAETPPVEPEVPPATVVPETSEVVPVVPEPVPSEVEAAAAVQTPEQRKEEYEQWYSSSRESLATDLYSISPEEVVELEGNAAEAFPKLLAKVHMNVLTSAMQAFANGMPAVLEQVQGRTNSSNAAQDAFNTAWPGLNKEEYGDQLIRLATAHAQAAPNVTLEQRIQEVGVQFCILNRLDPTTVSAPETSIETPPLRPVPPPTPVVEGSGPSAGGGSGPAVSQMEAFANEIVQDDG